MKFISLAVCNYGMASIIAAIKTSTDIKFRCIHIDETAFALVSTLFSYNSCDRHCV